MHDVLFASDIRTYKSYNKLYVHNNPFYSDIFKIRVNLPTIKLKEYYQGYLESFHFKTYYEHFKMYKIFKYPK